MPICTLGITVKSTPCRTEAYRWEARQVEEMVNEVTACLSRYEAALIAQEEDKEDSAAEKT